MGTSSNSMGYPGEPRPSRRDPARTVGQPARLGKVRSQTVRAAKPEKVVGHV